jgi:hypothetical protein
MLKRAGVLPQEVDNLMKVGAALKLGDREVVRQLAAPVFEALGLTLVEVLPKEIQDRIEQGALSEDDGRRLANVEFDARREQSLRERAEKRVQERDNADNAGAMERRFAAASCGLGGTGQERRTRIGLERGAHRQGHSGFGEATRAAE